ncbi:MAG: ribonuclease HII [Chromatiales bacterium]|nr:ribonuclease HII [Chromatiales bacterium]
MSGEQHSVEPGFTPGTVGVDEAGRGPLAGPVVAAAVLLLPGQRIVGVRDSKQLAAARREDLAVLIRGQAVAWAVAVAEVEEIDRLNIRQASLLAMRRAVLALGCRPALLRIDGRDLPPGTGLAARSEAVIGGDRSCPAIGAASILAKVHRDQLMLALDRDWPGYGFARHKGYPTADHRARLAELGPCPAHRMSFAPVRAALAREEMAR